MNDFIDISERERLAVLLRGFQTQINTCVPCVVDSVRGDRVDIALNVLRVFGNEVQDQLIVFDVPVVYPGAGDFNISFPINKGDTGIALFSQRSIDAWLESKTTKPNNTRLHDLSDAMFLPGLRSFSDTNIPNAMIVKSGDLTVTLKPGGKVTVDNGTFELVALIKELVEILSRTTTVPFVRHSSSTPTPEALITMPEFIALMAKLETF